MYSPELMALDALDCMLHPVLIIGKASFTDFSAIAFALMLFLALPGYGVVPPASSIILFGGCCCGLDAIAACGLVLSDIAPI